MKHDWEAEHRQLTERLEAARDRMDVLSPAQNVISGTLPIRTTDELADYSAAKAEFDAIKSEIDAFNNARAGSVE